MSLHPIANAEKYLKMEKKKVLIIANLSGFIWKFEQEDIKLLQELGYEVHCASNVYDRGYYFDPEEMASKEIVFHPVEMARSPYMYQMNKKALRQLITIIDRENISLIHCHTPVGGMLGRLAAKKSHGKPKVIYTAHGFHFYKGAPLFNNIVFRFAEHTLAHWTDALLVINEEDYVAAKKMHLRKNGKVYKLPGTGLDLDFFLPASKKERQLARKKLNISEETFFILSVGELNLNKNHKTAILALQELCKDDLKEEALLYGICGEGYFLDDIKKFAEESFISDKIRFFGYQREIREFYAAADLTLFPSIREGLGMAGLESMAMGIPVIAADNRGTREYMVDGQNGYIFPPTDEKACQKAILKYRALAEAEKKKMSACCLESVRGFSKENTRKIMKKVYTSL